jgi:hypothetical protein
MDVIELLEAMKGLDVLAIAEAAVAENVELIADLNATQLSQGLRADGSELLPSYADATVAAKRLAGKVSDHVTLLDTGAFYRGLYAAVQGEQVEYGSRDSKADKLQEKYSTSKGSIFGLNEDSREDLIESGLGASWQKGVEKVTGLVFT